MRALRQELAANTARLRATMWRTRLGLVNTVSVANGQPAEDEAQHDAVLSPRELEVLRLIAEGRSTKQLAWDLGIAFKTAVAHRTNIMRKLECHETATLVRYAVRIGLIKP